MSIPLDKPINFYYFTLVFVGLSVLAMRRILSSPFGSAIRAVRDNESRAAACGHNVRALKLLAFVFSGLFSGLAGALNVLHLRIASIDLLHWSTSADVVMMTLLGGAANFLGPFVGAGIFLVLQSELDRITEYWSLFIGTVLILVVCFFSRRRVRLAVAAVDRAHFDGRTQARRSCFNPSTPRWPRQSRASGTHAGVRSMIGDVFLRTEGLTRKFSGFVAVNSVDFEVRLGELRA